MLKTKLELSRADLEMILFWASESDRSRGPDPGEMQLEAFLRDALKRIDAPGITLELDNEGRIIRQSGRAVFELPVRVSQEASDAPDK